MPGNRLRRPLFRRRDPHRDAGLSRRRPGKAAHPRLATGGDGPGHGDDVVPRFAPRPDRPDAPRGNPPRHLGGRTLMLLTDVLAVLTAVSFVLTFWRWRVGLLFPLHRRRDPPPSLPGLTLLKPLKGCDAATRDCLRSW